MLPGLVESDASDAQGEVVMTTYFHYLQVAKELKRRLDGKAFLTLQRLEVTRLLRRASGASTTRIKCSIALNVERALLEHGVRCFPSLAETSTWDNVRLFHSGTATAELVDMLLYPSPETDRELADVLTKIKGKWNWSDRATDDTRESQNAIAA